MAQSEDEREMCSRTVYCTNIDKKVNHILHSVMFSSLLPKFMTIFDRSQYCSLGWVVCGCRFLKLKLRSCLKQPVVRLGLFQDHTRHFLPFPPPPHTTPPSFILYLILYRLPIESIGYSSEAFRGPCAFYSHCFCRIRYGEFFLLLRANLWAFVMLCS